MCDLLGFLPLALTKLFSESLSFLGDDSVLVLQGLVELKKDWELEVVFELDYTGHWTLITDP